MKTRTEMKLSMKLKMFLLLSAIVTTLSAQEKPVQKWLDQKFSMFIHFGLYSVYGGVYEGKPVTRGYSEQIQSFAGIFSDWYADTASEFNPLKWNPDSIVALAKKAGMRSIVLTSKHHDGFCMYHSEYTDFNIVDATPYGRDLMKELAEACKRGGIDFGVYFSLIDWHFPQAYPISSHNADPLTPEHYLFNLKQVEEIMTNYGEISEIWFDMGSLTPLQSKGLYELVNRLQPHCMISGRLGNDFVDFAVMADNEYPSYKLGVPWQTAASVFPETWGYRSWQVRGQVQPKVEEKIASLIKVISRGGNYLLNIGPRGDGSVVEFERDMLLGIGKWVKANAEAIYGTKPNPFPHSFEWGDITAGENCLYGFVQRVPSSSKIEISGFSGVVSEVKLLASGQTCLFVQNGGRLEVDLSPLHSEELFPVIKITFDDGFVVIPSPVAKGAVLTSQNSMHLFGHSSINYYSGYKSLIGYDWAVRSRRSVVSPDIIFTESEIGRTIELEIDGQRQQVTLQPSASEKVRLLKNSVKWGNLYRKPGRGVFGNIEVEGMVTIDVGFADNGWKMVRDFRYGEQISEKIKPRESILFLQEIESSCLQTLAVRVGCGNAVYILLNGEYVTAHFSPTRLTSQEEIVLLPLKKGNNQLVIKFYNGFDKMFSYNITPLEEWIVYTQNLLPHTLQKRDFHSVSLRSADAASNVSPLRLNNVTINLR
ncbi:alpha-L-fucosidase [Proteiniphilum sp. UBA5375]|uniref:alpha-L-fucosidase n=1 Tax=Proteiniphilum sp. UBA5375 TaxID=1947278 RepID=UPI00257F463C|nr:alpha-L-fucosidase [Proteiniphilum sp. UBA5375]